MNKPRVVVRYFGNGQQGMWSRFVHVLTASLRRQCQNWDQDIALERQMPGSSALGIDRDIHNTQKLDSWAAAVGEADLGDRLLLLDADTVIVRPIDDIWDQPFELAYTVKPKRGSRFPLNAGVMVVRVTPGVQAFLRAWATENRRMFEDAAYHQVWRAAYGGINQAALGSLLHQRLFPHVAKVRLPCLEWNCEDENWAGFDPNLTRIVHFKGELRRALMGKQPADKAMKPLIAIWKDLERGGPAPTRAVDPTDLSNTMVQPTEIQAPDAEPPRLTTRERRRRRREAEEGGPKNATA